MANKTILTIDNESFDLLSYHNLFFYPNPRDKMFYHHMDIFKEIENPLQIFGSMHKYHCWQHDLLAGYDHPSMHSNGYMPRANMLGGVFTFSIESAGREDVFENCMNSRKDHRIPILHGVINFYDDTDEYIPFQRIEFWDGIVCSLSESFSSMGSKPMTMQISISPATIRVNKSIVRQQCWWQTDIYEKDGKEAENSEPSVTNMYWMDKAQEERKDTIEINETVFLIVETEDYQEGQEVRIPITIEESGKKVTLEGNVDENGVARIEWTYLEK